MSHQQHVQLGAAIASAMRDSVAQWQQDHAPGAGAGEALAQYVHTIEAHASIKIGGPMTLVVEVNDRRHGHSTLYSYVLERSPKQKALFRLTGST